MRIGTSFKLYMYIYFFFFSFYEFMVIKDMCRSDPHPSFPSTCMKIYSSSPQCHRHHHCHHLLSFSSPSNVNNLNNAMSFCVKSYSTLFFSHAREINKTSLAQNKKKTQRKKVMFHFQRFNPLIVKTLPPIVTDVTWDVLHEVVLLPLLL